MTQTVTDKAVARIYGKGRGWTFSQIDFIDLGSRSAIDSILQRLTIQGTIRRVLPGIYFYPRYSKLLEQDLGPDIRGVADAIARKFAWDVQPHGASALNLMGVSTQVPAQYVFLSDGPSRTYDISGVKLRFKHVATKESKFKHIESAIIVHGLKSLSPAQVDDQVIRKIRNWLPVTKRLSVLRDTRTVTNWVHDAIHRICLEESK